MSSEQQIPTSGEEVAAYLGIPSDHPDIANLVWEWLMCDGQPEGWAIVVWLKDYRPERKSDVGTDH